MSGWQAPKDLQAWRRVGDPLADAVVEMLAQLDLPRSMDGSLGRVERCAVDRKLSAAQRKPFLDFLEFAGERPDWVDWDQVAMGQDWYRRYAPVASASLILGGLVASYANHRIARVLTGTGRFSKDTSRRIFETGAMVFDALSPDALWPGRGGARTVLKVRLMHAGVRRLMRRGPRQRGGVPINQEDLAYTLLMFDVVTRRGCEALGLTMSAEEREAYHHLWRVVGWLIGVDEALLPPDLAGAEALLDAISARQVQPSEEGLILTDRVHAALNMRPPFFLPTPVLRAITARLLGSELAAVVGVGPSALATTLAAASPIVRGAQAGLTRVPGARHLMQSGGASWGFWVLRTGLGDEPARFPIPGLSR